MKFLTSIVMLFCVASAEAEFSMSLEVVDSSGVLQTVEVTAERITDDEYSPSMWFPHVVFPNGNVALIDSSSNLDAVICKVLAGEEVFNPYRDLRMSFKQKLSYRRGLFDGTYMVSQNNGVYFETKVSSSNYPIMSLGCSEY